MFAAPADGKRGRIVGGCRSRRLDIRQKVKRRDAPVERRGIRWKYLLSFVEEGAMENVRADGARDGLSR
jgi:hypothetical protein